MRPPTLTIAVLGAGNLGLAQAGHLALLGHRVRLWNRSPQRLGALRSGNPLRLHGVIDGEASLELCGTDLTATVEGADLIFVDVPASAHAALAASLAVALPRHSRALLLLHPGQTFGARHLAQAMGPAAFPNLTLGELQTALYTSRSAGPGETTVLALKRRVAVASYPANQAERLAPLRVLYPQLFAAPSTLHTALSNVQSFIHPAVCLFNLTRIENGERFRIYREGLSTAVGECFERCDVERLAVARALSLDVPTAAQWFGLCYGVQAGSAIEAMQQVAAYDDLLGPADLATRLLWEDVPTGLLPLVELARSLGVLAPALSGLLAVALAVGGGELGRGWTLDHLGLSGLPASEILNAF